MCAYLLPFKGYRFLKEINASIQQICFKLMKNDSEDFKVLQKFIFEKCSSCELSINQIIYFIHQKSYFKL